MLLGAPKGEGCVQRLRQGLLSSDGQVRVVACGRGIEQGSGRALDEEHNDDLRYRGRPSLWFCCCVCTRAPRLGSLRQ